MGFQGRFYKVIKAILRSQKKYRYASPELSAYTNPAVYVCRHNDNKGPIVSMINLPIAMHPWAYHVWCDEESCRKQCVDYTFTVRYGWSERKAKIVAQIISKPFSALIRSAGSIPVYRNSLKVRETFKETIEALKRDESILIFPDVDYTSQEGDSGALYDGFLMLERLYFKEMGRHLPFIPLRLNDQEKRIELGEVITFRDDVPFKEDKERVIRALQKALNDTVEN